MTSTPLVQDSAVPLLLVAGLCAEGGSVGPAPHDPDCDALVPDRGVFVFGAFRTSPATDAAGFLVHAEGGLPMFEERPQPEIEALMRANPEFKQLYQRHKDLDKKVMDAELGVLPIDDMTLAQMKREKLAAKDRLVRLYDSQPH